MLEQQTTLGLVDVGKHGTGQLLCVPQRVVGHRTPAHMGAGNMKNQAGGYNEGS